MHTHNNLFRTQIQGLPVAVPPWLASLGMHHHVASFEAAQIHAWHIPSLDEATLMSLGVQSPQERHVIMQGVQQITMSATASRQQATERLQGAAMISGARREVLRRREDQRVRLAAEARLRGRMRPTSSMWSSKGTRSLLGVREAARTSQRI